MNLEKNRITPFPFPDHLAKFLITQLNTAIENIDGHEVKALHVSCKRSLGKMILRCLEKSQKPIAVKKGITFYISCSQNINTNDRLCEEARCSDVYLSEQSIKDITEVFEDFFRACLISFVDGCEFARDYKKGKRNSAIVAYIQKYNLDSDEKSVDRYKKMYQRAKKNHKELINSVL